MVFGVVPGSRWRSRVWMLVEKAAKEPLGRRGSLTFGVDGSCWTKDDPTLGAQLEPD
jgi:hypothetical protein